MSNQTDDELMLAIQKNNDLAYTELVNRHIDKLYGYLLRLTSNTNDAEDLVQETFLKVWNKSTTYKVGKVRFSTWLYRIAHNKFIDLYRKNKFRPKPMMNKCCPEPWKTRVNKRKSPERFPWLSVHCQKTNASRSYCLIIKASLIQRSPQYSDRA